MTRKSPTMLSTIRRYAGKMQTIRNQIRTERMIAGLSDDLKKDIGWPDRFNRGV